MADAKKYYEVLKIPYGSEIKLVIKAYRRLAKKYHPDKNLDEDAVQKFHQVKEAYEALSDPVNRKKLLGEKSKFTQNPKEFVGGLWNDFLTF